MLAAGLLDGLTAATHWGTAGEIEGYGAVYTPELYTEYDPQPPFDSGSMAAASPEVLERVGAMGLAAPETLRVENRYEPGSGSAGERRI